MKTQRWWVAVAMVGGLVAGSAWAEETLTLQQAVDAARAHSPTLIVAHASTLAGYARADEVRAGLLPQVNFSAGWSIRSSNFVPNSVSGVNGAGGVETNLKPYPSVSLGLSASQLVWDFQTFDRWRASQASALSLEDQEHASLLSVLAQARVAYFGARAAKALVKVQKDTLDNQQKHLDQANGFVKAGTQPEIALAQAKSAVATARVQLINAENGYASAKAVLNQAMGVERDTDYEVGDDGEPEVANEDAAVNQLVDQAIKARPELASLYAQLRAQELTLRAAKGGFGPAISLSAGITEGGQHWDALVGNYNAGINLSWNLFSGFLTTSTIHEQEANLDNLNGQTELTRQQVRLQVDQARLSVRAAKGSLSASIEAEDAAKDQLKLAEGRYQAGAGSIIELGDAQVAYTTAAAQHVQAEYTLATARAQLLQALGQE